MTSRARDPRIADGSLLFALCALAHITYFALSSADFFYPDSFTYLAPARGLLHGLGFATEAGGPETLRTPGYPLFLIPFLLLGSMKAVVIVQHLLDCILAPAIYLAVHRFGRVAAFAAALLFSFDPISIHYANKILSETLFTVLLFVAVAEARTGKRPIALGLLTGVLVLVRPVAVAYFLVLAGIFVWRKLAWRTVLAFVIAALVLPIGWGLRNLHRTGVFTVASIGGSNMLLHRAAGALAIEDDGVFREDLARYQTDLASEADAWICTKEHVRNVANVSHAVKARDYEAYALPIIRGQLPAFCQLTLRGFLVNLFESDWEAVMVVSSLHNSIVQIGIDALQVAIVVLAAIGLAALWKLDRPLSVLLALTIVYYLTISAGGESEARFRAPVMPLLAMAAGAGLQRAFREPR